jgi:hypothetical protein
MVEEIKLCETPQRFRYGAQRQGTKGYRLGSLLEEMMVRVVEIMTVGAF